MGHLTRNIPAAAVAWQPEPLMYRVCVQLENGFWEEQEAFADLDDAADMLICARDDGCRARVYEARGSDMGTNVTARAEAAIRAWLDLRGDKYPEWMA